MKNKSTAKFTNAGRPVKAGQGYGQLIASISTINAQMVGRVAAVANQALVLRNWVVGAYIVEFQQHGADRAKYGARLLETMAEDLKAKGMKGLGLTTLKFCRLFALTYHQIRRTVSDQLLLAVPETAINQTVSDLLLPSGTVAPSASSADSADTSSQTQGTTFLKFPTPLTGEEILRFSWSQIQELDTHPGSMEAGVLRERDSPWPLVGAPVPHDRRTQAPPSGPRVLPPVAAMPCAH